MAKYNPNSRLYQIDELISDVYGAVYMKDKSYKVKMIDISDLTIDRFKLTDYDLDTIFNKTKIKNMGKNPTGLRLDPENPNTSIDQFLFKRKGVTIETTVTIRIVPYFDNNFISSMAEPVNVNKIIISLC